MQLNTLIEEEKLLILQSGEIPEVAYHGSIYYLTEDPEGPQLRKDEIDLMPLKEAVIMRYQSIILRDLEHKNRDKRIYRGIARAIVNYRRLNGFANREGLFIQSTCELIKNRLLAFLQQEIDEVIQKKRPTCLNCTIEELQEFFEEIGIKDAELLYMTRILLKDHRASNIP